MLSKLYLAREYLSNALSLDRNKAGISKLISVKTYFLVNISKNHFNHPVTNQASKVFFSTQIKKNRAVFANFTLRKVFI